MKAILAVIEAAVEIVATFKNRDTTFDTSMPFASFSEPGLFLILVSLLGLLSRFREHDPFDTPVLGLGLIGC